MPSDDAADEPLYEPGIELIISMLRSSLGMPFDWRPSPEMLRDARAALRAAMRRRRRAKAAGGDDMPPPSGTGALSGVDALVDFLCSPEGVLMVDLFLAMPRIAAGFAVYMNSGTAAIGDRVLRPAPSVRIEADPIIRYIHQKLCSPERVPDVVPVPEWRLVAAVNCATPARASEWLHVLRFGSDHSRRDVMSEMQTVGRRAVEIAAPMRVWEPELGAPRGLLPDAPALLRVVEPPDDDPDGVLGTPRPPVR